MVDEASFEMGRLIAEHVRHTVQDATDQVVSWVHFPDVAAGVQACQRSKFAALELSSGTIGIAFTAYIPTDDANIAAARQQALIGTRAADLISWLGDPDALPAQRTISMAVVNALSTWHVQQHGLMQKLEFTDAFEALDIGSSDIVGMVGMFHPMIQPIAKAAKFLHVLELKPELVQSKEKWDVSLDPAVLRSCNKIIVTGTVLLNGTLASLVDLTAHAREIALIGPTASFLPDPLFDAGFTIVGGSIVVDPVDFKARVSRGEVWGESVQKYVVRKARWHAP